MTKSVLGGGGSLYRAATESGGESAKRRAAVASRGAPLCFSTENCCNLYGSFRRSWR